MLWSEKSSSSIILNELEYNNRLHIRRMLMGYCCYEAGNLISLDGDSYCLEDVITKYEIDTDEKDEEYLVVWIESEWV